MQHFCLEIYIYIYIYTNRDLLYQLDQQIRFIHLDDGGRANL